MNSFLWHRPNWQPWHGIYIPTDLSSCVGPLGELQDITSGLSVKCSVLLLVSGVLGSSAKSARPSCGNLQSSSSSTLFATSLSTSCRVSILRSHLHRVADQIGDCSQCSLSGNHIHRPAPSPFEGGTMPYPQHVPNASLDLDLCFPTCTTLY